MKVRIQGNTIRLRLKQYEVESFAKNKIIAEELKFSMDPDEKLVFTIGISDTHEFQIRYSAGKTFINIPEDVAYNWTNTEQVGIESAVPLNNNLSVCVLVEKDFKCLDRNNEDEVGSYPNPMKAC